VSGDGGLRIGVIGARGMPAAYGGFDTFVQELAPRLVALGHDVTVYCRRDPAAERRDEYRGVRLVHVPFVRRRELEELTYELASLVDSLRRPFELYYVLGTRGGPMYAPLRASRRIVVVNTDGLDWRRRKWNAVGRAYLRFAEWGSVRLSADHLVADAKAMRRYFLDTYGRDSAYLTNGAHVLTEPAEGVLDRWGLSPGSYYLIACRIEPENNVDLIIREFVDAGSDRELVVVGGMSHETPYWSELQELARRGRVRLLGPVYGPMLVESLHLGAYAYLHGHEVGGTNPALLKAMGCANGILALDTPFNAENLEGTGILWDKSPGDLASKIRWADRHPEELRALGVRARERIAGYYSWDMVAERHDRFFRHLARVHGLRP
jgi:glycosyltransferase involved in cell wall biosynthesis